MRLQITSMSRYHSSMLKQARMSACCGPSTYVNPNVIALDYNADSGSR